MTDTLAIFARYPRLAQVKTRLLPVLGERRCLQLHWALLLDTLDRTASLDLTRLLYVADCSEGERIDFSRNHLEAHAIEVRRQRGADLGERLWNAYGELSGEKPRVLFIGIDSPTLPLRILRQARRQLCRHAVVVGPCRDGGYYMMGVSEPRAELFQGIDWGSPRVLRQTLDRLHKTSHFLLPTWHDVDTWQDLLNLKLELRSAPEPLPVRTRDLLDSPDFLPSAEG